MDLYISGFPCQPFSVAGKQRGFEDCKARGTIFFSIAEYIYMKRPKCFLLENVKGLTTIKGGKYRKAVMSVLRSIGRKDGLPPYELHEFVLNTCQHGIPHCRARWYCVGIRSDIVPTGGSGFEVPQALIGCPSIDCFLDASYGGPHQSSPPLSRSAQAKADGAISRIKETGGDPDQDLSLIHI